MGLDVIHIWWQPVQSGCDWCYTRLHVYSVGKANHINSQSTLYTKTSSFFVHKEVVQQLRLTSTS